MSGSNPTMVVRVAGNIEQLRANLIEGKNQIETTTAAMQKMAASFNGDRLVQQANNVVAAIAQIGGVNKLTAAEQERVNSVLDRALEKYRVLGKEAPVGMQELADYTRKAGSAADGLHGALSRFDGVLASMGMNIGAEVRAIDEIASSAGKSAGEIGALATAGLALGAGFAGWKVGRMISDFFELDTKIGNATAKWLNWGDATGQAASARQDTINLAIARGADNMITFAAAIEFNTEWFKKQQVAAKASADEIKDGLHNQAELMKVMAEQQKLFAEMDKTTFGLAMDHQQQWRREVEATMQARNKTVVDGLAQIQRAEAATNDFIAKQSLDSLNYQILQIWQRVDEEEASFKGSEQQRAQFNRAVEALATEQAQALRDAADAAAEATEEAARREVVAIKQVTGSYWEQIDAAARAAGVTVVGHRPGESESGAGDAGLASHGLTGVSNGGLHPLRAAGGPVSAGTSYIVGEKGPELYTPGANGFITPNNALLGGGSGSPTYITIHVNGTAADVARKVMNEITKTMKASRQWPSA